MKLEDFGGGPSTGTLDNTSAWKRMLEVMAPNGGGEVELQQGAYWFNDTPSDVNAFQNLQLTITGKGASEIPLSKIVSRKQGIILHASKIKDVAVYYAGNGLTESAPDRHGIVVLGPTVIENCFVRNFPGNGIHIHADVTQQPPTNANTFRIIGGKALRNGGHGLYVKGGDANGGVVIHFRAIDNKGWGIYEDSFLGNTYIACPTASNTLGAIYAASAKASFFFGCYVEGGTGGKIQVEAPSVWVGSLGSPIGTGTIIDDGWVRGLRVSNDLKSVGGAEPTVYMNLGSPNYIGAFLEMFVQGQRPYRLVYGQPKAGWIGLVHNGVSPARCVFAFSTDSAVEGPGQLWIPQAFWTGFPMRKVGL
jgi:hypothetical protein